MESAMKKSEEDGVSLPKEKKTNPSPFVVNHAKPPRPRVTCLLVTTIAAAVVGSSAQFGYNFGVLNSPQKPIIDSFGQNGTGPMSADTFTSLEMNVAVAMFGIGGMVGSLPAGKLADVIGRKYTLLLNNIFGFLGVGLESLAVHPGMFITGRFIVGINSGISTVVVPLYISEISPIKLRGALGVLHQMAITITILLSQLLGITNALGRPDKDFFAWRILFAIPLLFSAFQLLVLPWCPKSPRFLFLKRRNQEAAIRALVRLRGSTADITAEKKEMEEELEDQKRRETVSLYQFYSNRPLRKALFISIILHLAQHSGINGIIYYSTKVFYMAGLHNPDDATVAVGVVLVIITLVTVFLVEVVGRRTLMLYGLGGMIIFFTLLTSMFCFQDGVYGIRPNSDAQVTAPGVMLVIFSLGIVMAFGLGPGAIPWLMVAELFLQEARPVAVVIATIMNWLANFIVGLIFPYILHYLYPYGTQVFAVYSAILWVPLYLFLPETKGRSVEEIAAGFESTEHST